MFPKIFLLREKLRQKTPSSVAKFQFLIDKIYQNTNFALLPNCQVPDGVFWIAVNFIIQDLKFYEIYHLFRLSFSHDRKIWGNERISFSRNPGLHSHWIFKFTTLLFSLELCKLIHFRPLTVFYCVQLLQESWLERIARFRFYIHIFENHTMIYIEAEKKRSIRSVARGISVGRNLVSKYLYLHLIFSWKANFEFSWMFTRSK